MSGSNGRDSEDERKRARETEDSAFGGSKNPNMLRKRNAYGLEGVLGENPLTDGNKYQQEED